MAGRADGIWGTRGPGLPCGARRLGDGPGGRVWLDVCIIGQHLPQMYRPGDLRDLTAEGCARLGLCPDCLGFGDLDPRLAGGVLEAGPGVASVSVTWPPGGRRTCGRLPVASTR